MKKNLLLLLFFCVSISYSQSTISYYTLPLVNSLRYPVAFSIAPDGRFFTSLKGGVGPGSAFNAFVVVHSPTGVLLDTLYDFTDSTECIYERGVLGVDLDPDFSNNHYVYVYYSHKYAGDERIRIVRFTEVNNKGLNPLIIFDLDVPETLNGHHVGGNLHFRTSEPDKLYFSIGDVDYQATDPNLNYSNKTDTPFGKILRINTDGSIPTDNPFYDDGDPLTGNCDYIWAYGLRNAFDFCFSATNDSLYCTENGASNWDEVNMIHKGERYGWANCEGNYATGSNTVPCSDTASIKPIIDWGTPVPSVTGILHYNDTTWPELNQHLIVADYNIGNLYDCLLGNAPYYDTLISKQIIGDFTSTGGLTCIKQGSEGCIYALHGGYTTSGEIFKICRNITGIKEKNNSYARILIYPNPANEKVSIELSDIKAESHLVEIVSINGNKIYSALCKNKTVEVPTNDLAAGLYFVLIKGQTGELLGKTRLSVVH